MTLYSVLLIGIDILQLITDKVFILECICSFKIVSSLNLIHATMNTRSLIRAFASRLNNR